MTNAYTIDDDQRDIIAEKIMSAVKVDYIHEPVKKALDELVDNALNAMTTHIADEYVLVFEEMVYKRADRLMVQLLKGDMEVAAKFGLAQRTDYRGEVVCYDNDKVRASIVETFKDAIVTAEIAALIKERDQLKKDVDFYSARAR